MGKHPLIRYVISCVVLFCICVNTNAEGKDSLSVSTSENKTQISKKGFSLGAIPVVAYDHDKGFQYGALMNVFDFGDGSTYPNPRQQWYLETSFYTKGTQQYILWYDAKHMIPGIRMSSAATLLIDKALDFYGFNGYQSFYDYENIEYWQNNPPTSPEKVPSEYLTAYYRLERVLPSFKIDLSGNIWDNKLFWESGYQFSWYKISNIDADNYNEGKDEEYYFKGPSLFEKYKQWGIISEDEADGGYSSAVRIGLNYDTRDFEAAPSRGLWAETHIILAPSFLGTSHPYYKYSVTMRQYFPLVDKKLTLAYRLNYQGTIGNSIPFYVMPFFSMMGLSYDRDGIGGYRTVRGLMRNRLQGLDVAFYNAELRWRFINFVLWKQNIALGLNVFSDGGIVTRDYDMSYKGADDSVLLQEYNEYMAKGSSESLHVTSGLGFRFILNDNFIIAFEYAYPFNKQDGDNAFYINTGYLF